MIRVRETPSFRRWVERLRPALTAALHGAVRDAAGCSPVGERKLRGFPWVRVRGCRLAGRLSLLGYEYRSGDDLIVLHAVGSHENFYRDLKSAGRPRARE